MAFFYTKFKGSRFDDHTLPIDMIGDVEVYASLIKKHAIFLYKTSSGKSRLPKNLKDSFTLKVTKLSEGSTKLDVDRVQEDSSIFRPSEDFLKLAMDDINNLIQHASSAQGSLYILPHLRQDFGVLGKNLRKDETIEWDQKDNFESPIRYNLDVRKIILSNLKNPYLKICEIQGVIDKPSVFDSTVSVRVEDKICLQVTCPAYLMDKIRDIHRITERYSVKFIGIGKFSADDQLLAMTAQHIVPYLDGKMEIYPSIAESFQEIAQLKPGWFEDGDGELFDSLKLSFSEQFTIDFVSKLEIPAPYIYPHPDSQISLEWTIGSKEVSITLDFIKNRILLVAYDVEAKKSVRNELKTDFKEPINQRTIEEFLADYFPGLNDE